MGWAPTPALDGPQGDDQSYERVRRTQERRATATVIDVTGFIGVSG
jgi:hypothetical protein